MELELRRLEDLAESVVNDFAYMRAREEEMRDTNGESHLPQQLYNDCPFMVYRVNKFPSALFWCVFNAVSTIPGWLADILSAKILSSKETYRMIYYCYAIHWLVF